MAFGSMEKTGGWELLVDTTGTSADTAIPTNTNEMYIRIVDTGNSVGSSIYIGVMPNMSIDYFVTTMAGETIMFRVYQGKIKLHSAASGGTDIASRIQYQVYYR